MPPHPARRRRGGFTLIELLAGIAILAILAALVIQTAAYIQDRSRREIAKNQIEALSALLSSCKADEGSFPGQPNGAGNDSSAVLVAALSPADLGRKSYDIPLRMFDSYRAGLSSTEIRSRAHLLVDPYGHPYHYQYPGAADRNGTASFDLWSQGKSDSTDPGDWIKNW